MKAWKIILGIVVVLFIGVAVTSWYLMNNMDRLVTESFEEGGQELLGVPVSVESMDLKMLAGKARVTGLTINNPPGYSSAPAMTFGVIEIELDLTSMDERVMVIENIVIRDPIVSYELDAEGVSNIDVLQERIDKATPTHGTDTGLLIIDRLDIKGGTITAMADDKTDRKLEFDFPVLFMTDLGEPDGAPSDQVATEITEALMERINKAAAQAGVDLLVDEQKDRLIDKASEKLDEKLKDLLKKRD